MVELFGKRGALVLKVGAYALVLGSLAGGALVFVLWSQTVGRLVLAPGLAIVLVWLVAKTVGFEDGFEARLRSARRGILAMGFLLTAAGWATYFLVHQDLGLLIVILAAAVVTLTLIGTQSDPMTTAAGPTDGPWYGDTSGN